jgi:YidC/Oxa1 family membrane protein insertase
VDERRLLLAFSLSLIVLVVFQMLFPQPTRPPEAPRPTAPVAGADPGSGEAGATPAATAAPSKSDELERRVDVETRDVVVGLTNRGARIVSWKLTPFLDANGKPEEMVQAASTGVLPLDVETGDAEIDKELREALFVASTEVLKVDPGKEGVLRLEYSRGDLVAEKELVVQGSGYLTQVRVSVTKGGRALPQKIAWGTGIGNPSEAARAVQGYEEPGGVALVGTTVEQKAAKGLKETAAFTDVKWIGVSERYFAAVWIPQGQRGAGELRQGALPPLPSGEARIGPVALLALPPGEPALLYVGPKDYRQLAKLGYELARVVPIGDWIGPIVVVFMDVLSWIHRHSGNYGWSVIWLTVLVNLVMAPLRHYSIANGLKMAKLAPEMKVIQERYRKVPALDPRRQEMQKELGALYAKHGMNMGTQMLVGCLPILLTFPFLIAIWRLLQVSIELRGASFLWIPDLSQKDPLYVTPVLMAVTMFLTQKLTPTTMEPAQQRMMMVMPIVLMSFVIAAPGGLNLYWFASNLCSIFQQVLTMRLLQARDGQAKERRR